MSHAETLPSSTSKMVARLHRHIDILATQEGGPTLDVVRSGVYEYDPVAIYALLIDTSSPYEGPMDTPDTHALEARCINDGAIIESLNVRRVGATDFKFEVAIDADTLILSSNTERYAREVEAIITSFYLRYGVNSLVKEIRKRK